MKRFLGLLISGALILGPATGVAMAQEAVKDAAKDVGKGTKKAVEGTGKAVGKTTKEGAKATEKGTKKAAKGTKKGVSKAADATAKGADKVADKTDDIFLDMAHVNSIGNRMLAEHLAALVLADAGP